MNKHMPVSKAKTAYGLLSEIMALILDEPLRYNQHTWLVRGKDIKPDDKAPSCGTIGCVAGWTCALKAPRSRGDSYGSMSKPASRILGITVEQSEELFDSLAAGGYDIPEQTIAHAQRGARHIASFQKKYAKQLKAKRI